MRAAADVVTFQVLHNTATFTTSRPMNRGSLGIFLVQTHYTINTFGTGTRYSRGPVPGKSRLLM